jgi:hypothetical protein
MPWAKPDFIIDSVIASVIQQRIKSFCAGCFTTRGRNESHEKQNNNNNTNKEIRKKI